MILSLEWRFAIRNLFRNKRRTFSTSFGLVIAFLGVSLLVAYLSKSELATRDFEIYLNHLGHIQVYKKGAIGNLDLEPTGFQISEAEADQLHQILQVYKDQIEFIAGLQSTEALLSTGTTSTPIWLDGFPPELDAYVYANPHVKTCCPYIVKGRTGMNMLEATKQHPDAISVSQGVSELLKRTGSIEQMSLDQRQLSIAGRDLDRDLNAVSATLMTKHTTGLPFIEDFSVQAPLSMVQNLLQTKTVSRFAIFLKDSADKDVLIRQFNKEFASKQLNIEAFPYSDKRIGVLYHGTISFLLSMGGFIGILLLVASGLIVMNSVTMSALERLKEIGTMRALGYPPKRIRNIFVREAFCISFLSGLIGIVLSEFIATVVNSMKLSYTGPGYSVRLPLELLTNTYFYLILLVAFVAVSTLFSFFVVGRKSQESIMVLLMDSGASA